MQDQSFEPSENMLLTILLAKVLSLVAITIGGRIGELGKRSLAQLGQKTLPSWITVCAFQYLLHHFLYGSRTGSQDGDILG